MRALFNELLPLVIDQGYKIDEYWDLSIGDIKIIIENKKEKFKSDVQNNYQLASMITMMIGSSFGGKQIPTIDSLYPTLFNEADENPQKDSAYLGLQKDIWVSYAKEYNKKRREEETKNGNR